MQGRTVIEQIRQTFEGMSPLLCPVHGCQGALWEVQSVSKKKIAQGDWLTVGRKKEKIKVKCLLFFSFEKQAHICLVGEEETKADPSDSQLDADKGIEKYQSHKVSDDEKQQDGWNF